jgi:hypothetical protein
MKKFISGTGLLIVLFSACVKKVDPVDTNNATVELTSGTKYVTEDITVNPKDSIFFGFTIRSNRHMKYVSIQKNPVNQTAFLVRDTLTEANKNSYSATKKFMADSANGSYMYRIVAHDVSGNYIGSKDVIVVVNPDFNFYSYRFLYVPDTTAKVNTAYMSARNGNVYSYTTGAASSADIDFGFFYDTTGAASTSTTDDFRFSLYALTAIQPQLSFYDITSWTKNATIMKKATTPAFNTLTSAGALRSAAVTNLATLALPKVTQLVAGNLVFFRTASGKAGCLQVNFASGSSPAKESYINVDVKIEK